ncbi:MAG: deacylase, partial [Campylobacterales bacterium]|nr:deacylase [Campylobacterales bacterium]
LQDEEHRFSVKNTQTKNGDKEMEKSLTYFAINNQKAAFGIETTKNFPTHLRVYYQLLAIEGYLHQAGIKFKRNFEMNPNSVKKALESDIIISFADKISFDLSTIKDKIIHVPLSKDEIKKQFKSNNPLVGLIETKDYIKVQYGNRFMTKIYPAYFDYDLDTASFDFEIDGEVKNLKFGSIVNVKNYFKAVEKNGYRVNIIGYVGKNESEHDVKISKKDLPNSYAIDKQNSMYRVEVYKDNKFSGMFVMDFSQKRTKSLNNNSSFICKLQQDLNIKNN